MNEVTDVIMELGPRVREKWEKDENINLNTQEEAYTNHYHGVPCIYLY